MTLDPYGLFIRAVASDLAIFQQRRCLISRKALNDIGEVIASQPFSVATTYILDRANRLHGDEQRALICLQAHIRRAAGNGLNPGQVGFLVRKLEIFPQLVEALQ
jgi:hypothetical protein